MDTKTIDQIVERDVQKLCPNDSESRKAYYREAIRNNIMNWEAKLAANPEETKLEIAFCWFARVMATERPDSPQYAQAQIEYHRILKKLLPP